MVRERGHGDLTEGTLGLGAETDWEARRAWCLALRGPKHILYHLWPCCNLLSSARPSFVRLCLSLALGTCRRNEHSFMLNVPDWKDRLQPEGSCRCWGGRGGGGEAVGTARNQNLIHVLGIFRGSWEVSRWPGKARP